MDLLALFEGAFGIAPWVVVALVGVATVAGFVDSIAGGGGLLTVPAALLAGLPQVEALATNKLQSTFGSFSATLRFARAGLIDLRSSRIWCLWTLAGAAAGALAVSALPADAIRIGLPALLAAVALFFLLSPRLSDEDARARISGALFGPLIGAGVGFYDGLFGPGTGSFFMVGFVALLGYNVRRATAHTKLLNFMSNLAALAVFLAGGHAHIALGVAMGLGQFVGARAGAGLAIRDGARIVKPMLVVMCVAMAARLAWDAWR